MTDTQPAPIPPDLSTPAVKAARRLQALPMGRGYTFTLVKLARDKWLLLVHGADGVKVEVLK